MDDDEEPRRSIVALSQELGDSSRAKAGLEVPQSSAPPAPSALVVSAPIGQLQATLVTSAAAPTHPTPAFSLHRVPEDQTGAGKEAMIQAEQMILRVKEAYEASKLAYDASSALRANVRVSAIVSSFLIEFLSILTLHPLGVFFWCILACFPLE